ncbi:hypothetical protein KIL84_001585 [Mauremys mutica]|uniref:Ig-like domain-containing protein n=1 Tax=Mauremys mutica TaxID=74926 RepID=A0A9D3XJE7_9SAUR|nr:hypothetical protein KIL84_001585 [Mauremys mutica]
MATRWRLCVCSLGILLLAPCSLSEEFSLAGSLHPVVEVVGQDVVLPCQLSPQAGLPSMDVQWRKAGPGFILVHEYMHEDTQDLPGEGYQTRTSLFLQEFSSGNVSLKLKQVQVADTGTYHCFVRNPQWTLEATTELQVAAVAPVFIDVLGPRGQGIGLACRSAGWFPKPELRWIGKNWQNLAMEIVTNMTQNVENLYSVVSHVTVTEGEDNGDISCIVRNGLLETERQSAIHLSGDIFPRVSPWLAAFWVMFTLVLIAAGTCAYLGYTAKRKASQKKRSKEEALLNLERQELHKTIASKEKKIKELEQDFRRARSYMAMSSSSQEICSVPGALPSPILYQRRTFARPGDSVQLTCSVFSRTPATRVIFCKDGEEVSSQTGLVGKLTYDYDLVVSGHSSGNYSCALRAPTLYLSQTSAQPGDSVQLQCSVLSQIPATRVVFYKDGEEVSSQMGSEEKVTYDYYHMVSRDGTGNYSCGYEIKDSDNQLIRSLLSPAQHLSVTGLDLKLLFGITIPAIVVLAVVLYLLGKKVVSLPRDQRCLSGLSGKHQGSTTPQRRDTDICEHRCASGQMSLMLHLLKCRTRQCAAASQNLPDSEGIVDCMCQGSG